MGVGGLAAKEHRPGEPKIRNPKSETHPARSKEENGKTGEEIPSQSAKELEYSGAPVVRQQGKLSLRVDATMPLRT